LLGNTEEGKLGADLDRADAVALRLAVDTNPSQRRQLDAALDQSVDPATDAELAQLVALHAHDSLVERTPVARLERGWTQFMALRGTGVLAAQRMSEAQLVEARTKAEVQRIEAQTDAETQRVQAETQAQAQRWTAQAEAEAQRLKVTAEIESLRERAQAAQAYSSHPALLRLHELETLRDLARIANARIYIGFDKHAPLSSQDHDGQ